jgi:hypothetical protein
MRAARPIPRLFRSRPGHGMIGKMKNAMHLDPRRT